MFVGLYLAYCWESLAEYGPFAALPDQLYKIASAEHTIEELKTFRDVYIDARSGLRGVRLVMRQLATTERHESASIQL